MDEQSNKERVSFNIPTLPPFELVGNSIRSIYSTGQITNSSLVRQFEIEVRDLLEVTNAVALSNCTSGLILSIKCLGITGKIAMPSFTFLATAHAAVWNGLEPAFVDINPETWNIDIEALKRVCEEDEIGAVLPVHVFGSPCDVKELEALSIEKKISLIFDSAHAMGSKVEEESVGRFGNAEVFSLSPTKLVVAGEGGMVCTNYEELAENLRAARDYGNRGDYDPEIIGLNARMSELHAALGIESFRMLQLNVERRNNIAKRYKEDLSGLPGIVFQKILPGCRSSFKDITILLKEEDFGIDRDALGSFLQNEGIDTRKYYYPPVHRTKAYWERWGKYCDEQLPVTNYVSRNVLSLPVWSHMDLEIVDFVCENIEYAHLHAEKLKQQK